MTRPNEITDSIEMNAVACSFRKVLENIPYKPNVSAKFPVHVFPGQIQDIINQSFEALNFPKDFTGASILFAVSVASGNCYNVEVKKGWNEGANLYVALVGKAGTNKSHPLSFALQPILKMDKKTYGQYKKDKETYDFYSGLTKKELREANMENLVEPVWAQIIISDFTQEALGEALNINRKGLGVYADELVSWYGNFNRYNSGSEEQAWLSIWNLKELRVNRKSSPPLLISKPYVSVIGTIQPGVLCELANSKRENGFMDRILFAYPKSLKREAWSDKDLDPKITQSWQSIMDHLLAKTPSISNYGDVKPQVLPFAQDAKKRLYSWKSQLTNFSNQPENEIFAGVCAKIEVNAIRLSLIMELLKSAESKEEINLVSLSSVEGAIELAEYFLGCALRVYKQSTNPLKGLSTEQLQVYTVLPESFKTGDGVLVAAKFGMAERTFKRFIKKEELFECISTGHYKKLKLND